MMPARTQAVSIAVLILLAVLVGSLVPVLSTPRLPPAQDSASPTDELAARGHGPAATRVGADNTPPVTGLTNVVVGEPPEEQIRQTFDLEPMGSVGEGWTRSDPTVGIAPFPTSVDRSLAVPMGDGEGGHFACRDVPSGVEDLRIIADFLLDTTPSGDAPALMVGSSLVLLSWRSGTLLPAGAGAGGEGQIEPRKWYRLAVDLKSGGPTFDWAIGRLEPELVLGTGTGPAGIPQTPGPICFTAPLGSGTLFLDSIEVRAR